MGNNAIYKTTPWLAYASWTWEVLRRNPDYISYYKSLRNKGLSSQNIGENLSLITASQRYPSANKFGLLFPADPDCDAGETPVFWHPDVFKSVVRFHVVDKGEIDRKNMPIKLSKCPGLQTHYLSAEGTYHIRFLARDFWFQIQCDNIKNLSADNFIGLEFNRMKDRQKRLKSIDEIAGIYDGSIGEKSGLHVPARLIHHQRSYISYDIRMAGGSFTDVVSALKQAGLVEDNPEKMTDFEELAKNAFRRAKAHIHVDYLQILDRN